MMITKPTALTTRASVTTPLYCSSAMLLIRARHWWVMQIKTIYFGSIVHGAVDTAAQQYSI